MVSHSQVMDPEEIAVFHVVAVYGLGLVFYDCSHKLPCDVCLSLREPLDRG